MVNKKVGIIAEFNPFHSGHKYLIEEIRRKFKEDIDIVCVMSEFFTQRGDAAIIDGYKRGKEAILSGIDLVIALPYQYSVAYSDIFAERSVKLLIECSIDYLAFGTEKDINFFEKLYEIENSKTYIEEVKLLLKKGMSYGLIMKKLLKLEDNIPNFILGYSYYKALKKYAPNVKMISIERKGQGFNEKDISQTLHLSATAIRKNIDNKMIDNYISNNMLLELRNTNTVSIEDFYKLINYKILTLGKKGLEKIYDIKEGLENRIYEAALKSTNYEDLVNNIATKRYSKKRIQRILVHILVDLVKIEELNKFRILAVNKDKTSIIREINKREKIVLYQKLNRNNEKYFLEDIKVARIYNLIYQNQDIFKYNIEIIKK